MLHEIVKKKRKRKATTCAYSGIHWNNVAEILQISGTSLIVQQQQKYTEDDNIMLNLFTTLETMNAILKTELQLFVYINAMVCYACREFKSQGILLLYEKKICGSYLKHIESSAGLGLSN